MTDEEEMVASESITYDGLHVSDVLDHDGYLNPHCEAPDTRTRKPRTMGGTI